MNAMKSNANPTMIDARCDEDQRRCDESDAGDGSVRGADAWVCWVRCACRRGGGGCYTVTGRSIGTRAYGRWRAKEGVVSACPTPIGRVGLNCCELAGEAFGAMRGSVTSTQMPGIGSVLVVGQGRSVELRFTPLIWRTARLGYRYVVGDSIGTRNQTKPVGRGDSRTPPPSPAHLRRAANCQDKTETTAGSGAWVAR
jgi:hypothetical protein